MIHVDESDPVGEIEPAFPYKDVTVRRDEFNSNYELQEELGRGKFGTVYLCKDKKNGLKLAVKIVNTTKKEDRRSVEREVEIMRRLQHPRLIQLYDAIDNTKQFYVVLELIEGGELFERVIDDDFVLTERSCAVFMRQICEGIEFVHSQNILHLDMKPENILCLTKEGNRIKIIDFGLARQFDPRKKLQVLFGTPEFVAPEVVNFDQIGYGTDMWSIGVICYVLLSGLSPFMGDTDVETMANVTIAKYDFDHEAFNNISEDAKDFIRRLLVKDKEKRISAHVCRFHPWLAPKSNSKTKKQSPLKKKKKTKKVAPLVVTPASPVVKNKSELDVTKDNLKQFVERWRDHPNSPYLFEDNGTVEREGDRSMSLKGQSPSPPESICSLTSEGAFDDRLFLNVPNLAFERRASEGQGQEYRDPASQIKIAEEIIKLSEHLRLLASREGNNKMAGDMANMDNMAYGEGKSKKVESEIEKNMAENTNMANMGDMANMANNMAIGQNKNLMKREKIEKNMANMGNMAQNMGNMANMDNMAQNMATRENVSLLKGNKIKKNTPDMENKANMAQNMAIGKDSGLLTGDKIKKNTPNMENMANMGDMATNMADQNTSKAKRTNMPNMENIGKNMANMAQNMENMADMAGNMANMGDMATNMADQDTSQVRRTNMSNMENKGKNMAYMANMAYGQDGSQMKALETESKVSSTKSSRVLINTSESETNEINEKLSAITRDRKLNGTKFNPHKSFQETVFNRFDREDVDIDLTPPWRKARAKHRFGETCRDVPRITNLQNLHKTMNLDEPNSAKNLLLKLLDEWDQEKPRGSALPRKSISVDWNDESIGRRSINSLARYFQTVQKSREFK
ncbi:serine/threonine-protein kinase dst2-like isoform X4 [Cotesia glomerata]|uniref:serine/threonine-protein kinase dst2-like isoform X4 n=1 Tax=Cotesia glomerata TaxID=32391 RepID=UPI001D01E615|nr:serine/threonine-protein kinase dst2-like isoform X4 [Cotesia glomerata]